MVRALWLTGLVAALAQAASRAGVTTVAFDNGPRAINDLNTTLAVTPSVLHPDSPLLSFVPDRLSKRKAIDVVVAVSTAVGAASTVVIAFNSAIQFYDNIAAKIKAKSDANSCTLTFGTESDDTYYEGYTYQASTTGKKCDTTALLETIQDAVQKCADSLHKSKAVTGCCKFSHGGTWNGLLKLTANPNTYPASSVHC